MSLFKKIMATILSNSVDDNAEQDQIATYTRNLEVIREFSKATTNAELATEAAHFWSEALTVSEDAEPPLAVRRLIRHVAGFLEVVPVDTLQRPDSELVDLIQTARQEVKNAGRVDTGFDALEHRIKRLKETLG